MAIQTLPILDENKKNHLGFSGAMLLIDKQPKKETEKAIEVRVINFSNGSNSLFWIPKSLMKVEGEDCIMPSWFIKKTFAKLF